MTSCLKNVEFEIENWSRDKSSDPSIEICVNG